MRPSPIPSAAGHRRRPARHCRAWALGALALLMGLAGGPAVAGDAPTTRVVAVTPHWAIRALGDPEEDAFLRCEAVAFQRDQDAELTLRLDADGRFSLGLASPDDLVPPGLTRDGTVMVDRSSGAVWPFPADLVGEVGGIAVEAQDPFALAFALPRGWRVSIPASGILFRFPLAGAGDALAALAECGRFFGVPPVTLPPPPDPVAPAEDG